jgi:hypothetical protein|uniref:DUF5901 domain-containing protein n=1 Tax=viral metagenome TaxID=1070528 RepID=A0A6C0JPG6_9ZZZZ
MSIEDVDFMKQHSIKENFTFIIDSSKRNKTEYPNPNNYSITFDMPFKNVFGIEVLDVSIPKTMYNIDINTNILKIYINTTKNPIDDLNDIASPLEWTNQNSLRLDNLDSYLKITNSTLSNRLRFVNNFTKDELLEYNITNLKKNNYINVVNINKWTNINNQNNIRDTNSENSFLVKYEKLSKAISNNVYDFEDSFFSDNEDLYNNIDINYYIETLDYNTNFYLNWEKYNIEQSEIDNLIVGNKWRLYNESELNLGNKIINEAFSDEILNKYYTENERLGIKWEYFSNYKPKYLAELSTDNYNNLIEKLNQKLLDNEQKFIELDRNDLGNIDLSGITINNYVKIDSKYYKPVDINIISNSNSAYDFSNFDINNYISISINLKWLKIPSSSITNDNIKYDDNQVINNILKLNNMSTEYNFDYYEWKMIINQPGYLWYKTTNIKDDDIKISNTELRNYLNNINTSEISLNYAQLVNFNLINTSQDIKLNYNSYIEISDTHYYKIKYNNLKNKYILVDNSTWIPQVNYIRPYGKWINNIDLFVLLFEEYENFCLNWINIGTIKPFNSREIHNELLSNQLKLKTNFTTDELNEFNLDLDLIDNNTVILSDNNYYSPKLFEISEDKFSKLNIEPTMLEMENFVKISNNYFKIRFSNLYVSLVNFYTPVKKFNLNNDIDYKEILDNYFEEFSFTIPIGNYTINKLIYTLNTLLYANNIKIKTREKKDYNKFYLNKDDNIDISLQCLGNSNPPELTNIIKFESKRKFILDMNLSTSFQILGFSNNVNTYKNEIFDQFSYYQINSLIEYENFYHSININGKETIIAPGMVYLIGTRYILLKCPEIEQHLYGSFSYTKNSMGLAKLRTSFWGLNEDYSIFKLPLREFHPIGKLDKLTLRFENPDGSLYNFRGIDHDIVFAIYYYSPKQTKIFEKSINNPEYKLDFISYKYGDKDDSYSEDDDDESNLINNYKKKEQYFSSQLFNNGYELNNNKKESEEDESEEEESEQSEQSEEETDKEKEEKRQLELKNRIEEYNNYLAVKKIYD